MYSVAFFVQTAGNHRTFALEDRPLSFAKRIVVDDIVGILIRRFDDSAIAHHIHQTKRRLPVLTCAEHVAFFALSKIDLGKLEAIFGHLHCTQTLKCRRRLRTRDEIDSPGLFATSYTATQLMKLRKTETVGIFDDHDRGIGNIDAHFDDRGRNEHIDLSCAERFHDRALLFSGKPSMKKSHAR